MRTLFGMRGGGRKDERSEDVVVVGTLHLEASRDGDQIEDAGARAVKPLRGAGCSEYFCESALWWRGHPRRPAPYYSFRLFRPSLPQMVHLSPG